MSAWRRKALEIFPERRNNIERARSIYDLLSSFGWELRDSYQSGASDPAFVDRVFGFAGWCWDARQNWELRNAVAVSFFEHLPAYGADARRDLVARLSAADLVVLRPLFRQTLKPPVYSALEAEIGRVHGAAAATDAPAI